MLPRVKIKYLSGALGKVADSPDGLFAIVCGANAVNTTFSLNQSYTLRSLQTLKDLGVNSGNNSRLYKHVQEFYDEVPEGTKLIVYGVAATRKLTELCDRDNGEIRKLIIERGGALRGILIARDDNSSVNSPKGIDPDVISAAPKAQLLADWATIQKFAPVFIILEGRGYTGTNLYSFAMEKFNRVGILVGDTDPNSKGACIGVLAGRLAMSPPHRNIGRVKDGRLNAYTMYLGGTRTELAGAAIEEAHDKRYITIRSYVGRSGYYFSDDNLACFPLDDYAQIAPRRVIDKAFRIAYDAMLDTLLDELEVNEDGTLQVGVIKSIQQSVENAINRRMTAFGELSSGEDGKGCVCYIDEKQNVLATSRLHAVIKVRPYGYSRYVDVDLGFAVKS